MNESQILTAALASVPTMLTVLVGILINDARLSDLSARLGELRAHMDERFKQVDDRFRQIDVRLGEMKELWRSELRRVEEVIDARLKHIER